MLYVPDISLDVTLPEKFIPEASEVQILLDRYNNVNIRKKHIT